ncbi:molybdopterin-dependent oxidoreductase [Roseibacillus ishigakijimensis]|uniref:Molybdopterin-dependent oxidoreductase n=1 Tax=Roseibacillus ishigakijimensis TaxID=454146 RepID=A0A934RPT0_9BACT|nr:molybdopterin-dependent oxidoreductase [Roseibacillus ishigakijimensis]MBK1833351.1 molybdopterin-dependent oxidoreductase [Roseibacillus ishigakijimensis]
MSDSATTTPTLPKDLAAEKGLVNVQIDGHWIQVPKGTRMIEACKQAEKEVPHYCYHPKLSSPGNCRMCLVQMGMPPRLAPGQDPEYNEEGYQEIGWMPRPVIACANTVAENMGIRTGGELVEKCREGVMEFLLINHPLDCPICDQAGECSLQEFSVEHGKGLSRFQENKVKKPKNVDIGPRIRLDDERCIMCSRCIRFMDEVADDPVLGFTDRGTHTTLAVHPGRKLDNNYGLNTVDICPVGALTSNDFRFQMRVWFLKETPSIDVNCGTGCNITIWTRGNEIFRITPRENNEVNSAWMPDSHRLAFHEIHSDRRLTSALVKNGGQHQPTTQADALAQAAAGFQGLAGEEVALITSPRATNEELLLIKKIKEALGTENLALVERKGESDGKLISADRNPNTTGAQLILGEKLFANFDAVKEDIASGKIKAALVIGEDLTEHGFTTADLAKLEHLVVLDILSNPTAGEADVVLPGASFAEKRGSMVNITGRLQRLNRAILPPGDASPDWELLAGLLEKLDGGAPKPQMIQDVFTLLASEVKEFADHSLQSIGDLGVPITETGETIPLLEKERQRIKNREIVG